MDSRFKQYRKKSVTWARPYEPGEDLTYVSVSMADIPACEGGMIAINPENEADQWYIAKEYFESNFIPVESN